MICSPRPWSILFFSVVSSSSSSTSSRSCCSFYPPLVYTVCHLSVCSASVYRIKSQPSEANAARRGAFSTLLNAALSRKWPALFVKQRYPRAPTSVKISLESPFDLLNSIFIDKNGLENNYPWVFL